MQGMRNCFTTEAASWLFRYQVLAVATDAKTKEESQNLKSGKKVVVSSTNESLVT